MREFDVEKPRYRYRVFKLRPDGTREKRHLAECYADSWPEAVEQARKFFQVIVPNFEVEAEPCSKARSGAKKKTRYSTPRGRP